ncbi:DUF6597 domain-containing transcriptional factor [Pedobacter ureilyticus]|uniref:DUF6597 domain-containing transcriptional factor n=1 Tax=Pedobacter ureilyticus TaxID=1393051 RepID=A0ABW9JA52_9SPHI|nr:helix-turn-helix transcriptional regulator [Pedobacter helvus]
MEYKKVQPSKELEGFIHFYWELKGQENISQRERVFPDGCAGIIFNFGENCITDNGSMSMEFGKTYVVGSMNTFKESIIESDTHLLGVCLKPAAFANFYCFAPQNELTNDTVELEKSRSFNIDKISSGTFQYFDTFLADRMTNKNNPLQLAFDHIHETKGQISVHELSKSTFTTVRQLERNFRKFVGLSPKEYSNIIRFQHSLEVIRNSEPKRSLLDISFECGYYDHAHLSNEFKRYTGFAPSSF